MPCGEDMLKNFEKRTWSNNFCHYGPQSVLEQCLYDIKILIVSKFPLSQLSKMKARLFNVSCIRSKSRVSIKSAFKDESKSSFQRLYPERVSDLKSTQPYFHYIAILLIEILSTLKTLPSKASTQYNERIMVLAISKIA